MLNITRARKTAVKNCVPTIPQGARTRPALAAMLPKARLLRSHMRNELAYDHIFFSSLIPPRGSLHERLAELAAVRVLSPGCNGLGAEFGAPSYIFMSDEILVLSRYIKI